MTRVSGGIKAAIIGCAIGAILQVYIDRSVAQGDGWRLIVVPHSDSGRAALRASEARTIATYEAFTLVEATGIDVSRLVAAGGDVREDMREVRVGRISSDPKVARPVLLNAARGGSIRMASSDGYGLAVVQYAGPLKDEWVTAVRATGVGIVSYMAQNAQLVSGDAKSLYALGRLGESFIRAITPYTAADKLLLPDTEQKGLVNLVVSTVAGRPGYATRGKLARLSTPLGDEVEVAGIVQHRIVTDAANIEALSHLGGVVAIELMGEPVTHDERARLRLWPKCLVAHSQSSAQAICSSS